MLWVGAHAVCAMCTTIVLSFLSHLLFRTTYSVHWWWTRCKTLNDCVCAGLKTIRYTMGPTDIVAIVPISPTANLIDFYGRKHDRRSLFVTYYLLLLFSIFLRHLSLWFIFIQHSFFLFSLLVSSHQKANWNIYKRLESDLFFSITNFIDEQQPKKKKRKARREKKIAALMPCFSTHTHQSQFISISVVYFFFFDVLCSCMTLILFSNFDSAVRHTLYQFMRNNFFLFGSNTFCGMLIVRGCDT